MRRRRRAALALLLPLAAFSIAGEAPGPKKTSPPLITGLDHVPVAVGDLDAAARQYRRLGFVLKEGTPHHNGIRNQHAKFRDGTEIELITAPERRDALTGYYISHIAKGDGPAFLALFVPEMGAMAKRLDLLGQPYRRSAGHLGFGDGDPLRYLFFAGRNASPTDKPEHFAHPNGAESLVGVWLAADHFNSERRILTAAGVPLSEQEVSAPESRKALVALLPEGEVVFLPASRQIVPGRRIVGATLRTRDLSALQRALAVASLPAPAVVQTHRGSSIFLSPDLTHGLWLEFRQTP